jgi:hypothetical protein
MENTDSGKGGRRQQDSRQIYKDDVNGFPFYMNICLMGLVHVQLFNDDTVSSSVYIHDRHCYSLHSLHAPLHKYMLIKTVIDNDIAVA